jgi:hypothetical protein
MPILKKFFNSNLRISSSFFYIFFWFFIFSIFWIYKQYFWWFLNWIQIESNFDEFQQNATNLLALALSQLLKTEARRPDLAAAKIGPRSPMRERIPTALGLRAGALDCEETKKWQRKPELESGLAHERGPTGTWRW